jgi:cytochrome c-type biogenesis protein CcmH
MAALATGAAVVALALAIYAAIGTPGDPDMPREVRLRLAGEMMDARPSQADAETRMPAFIPPPATDTEFLELMEKLRATVADRPDDLDGWTLLARNEAALGNFAAAHVAQARVVGLKGDAATAGDLAELAGLRVLAAGGFVSPEAEAALTRALALDGRNQVARYYTGLLFAQNGRPDLAFRLWRPLLTESPPDAPWLPPIRAAIGDIAALAGIRFELAPELPAPRGPDAADIAAAAQMSPEDRQAMVGAMVEGLAGRLADKGGPPEDWARLITSLAVLGERDRATAIRDEALGAFAGDAAALAAIRAAADAAGLE